MSVDKISEEVFVYFFSGYFFSKILRNGYELRLLPSLPLCVKQKAAP